MFKKILSVLLVGMMLLSASLPLVSAKEDIKILSVGTDATEAKAHLWDALSAAVSILTSPEINTYTPESCANLEQEVALGYEVYYNPDATLIEINAQTANVYSAIANMEKQGDTEDAVYYLSTIINEVEMIIGSETDYTPDSWAVFMLAYEEALYVQSNGQYEREFITAADNLKEAMDCLERVNSSILNARQKLWSLMESGYAILDSDDRYTEESLENLQTALQSANDVYYSTTATAEVVNSEADALQNVINDMVKIAVSEGAFSYLAEVIATADTLVGPKENYTAASWEVFAQAYTDATEVFENGESDEEFNLAANKLGLAINSLVPADMGVKTAREYLQYILKSAHQILSSSERYTQESISRLEEATEQANAVYLNDSSTETELYIEAEKLENVINSMEKIVISEDALEYLSKVINRANAEVMAEENYTPDSWAVFEKAYSEAVNTLNFGESDEEFISAANGLKNAIDSLVTIDFEKEKALSELEALVKSAEETQGSFTEESQKALEDAVKSAKSVLADEQATIEKIREQIEKLEKAIDNLEQVFVSEEIRGALSKVIEKAEAEVLVQEEYTADSYKEFADAFALAKEVYNTSDSEEEFASATDGLYSAINKLVLIKDIEKTEALSDLSALIKRAEETQGSFTEESLKALEDAVKSAKSVLVDEQATIDKIREQTEILKKAIENLEVITVAPEAIKTLENVLDKAESQVGGSEEYTEESFKVYETALKNALSVLENGQSDGDYYLAAQKLQSAMDNLVLIKDVEKSEALSELSSLVDSAEKIKGKFTEKSLKALEDAVKNAKEILADEQATIEKIREQLEKLKKAIDNLEQVFVSDEIRDALSKAIEKAETEVLSQEEYTSDSYKAFSDAFVLAKEVYNTSDSEEEFASATDGLYSAINKLILIKDVEKSEALEDLSALIKSAEKTQGNFTEESLKALEDAVKSAKSVLADEQATIEKIREQTEILKKAIENLEVIIVAPEAIKTLENVLDKAESQVGGSEEYTEESFKVYETALKNALSVLENGQSDGDYYLAAQKLQSAMDNLVLIKDVEKSEALSELALLVERAEKTEGNFTEESQKTLEDAVKGAKSVLADEQATIEKIREQTKKIKKAIDNLEVITVTPEAVKTLEDVIEKAETLVGGSEEYTAESFEVYDTALKNALSVLGNGQSDEEYYLAAQLLQSAMDNLVSAPVTPATPDEVYVLLGDVDGDGKVTVKDATYIQKCVAGLNVLEGYAEISADANRDGVVNIKDATEIQKSLAGLKAHIDIGKEVLVPPISG